MSNELAPLTPAIVVCCQRPIMAVKLADNRIAATLQSLCEALQLNRSGQRQRIVRQPLLARQLLLAPIATKSGLQQMDILIASAIPAWLVGVQLNRLAPEKQALIFDFQEQAVDTLYQYFFKRDVEAAVQSAPTIELSRTAPDSLWEMLYEAIQAFELDQQKKEKLLNWIKDEIAKMKQHQTRMEAEVAAVKQEQARTDVRLAMIEKRLAGKMTSASEHESQPERRILSLEHLGQAYVLARALRRQKGEEVSDVLHELAGTFGVKDISDLPDDEWRQAISWF